MISWDDAEESTTEAAVEEKDFLLDGKEPVEPMACPLNPEGLEGCEACQ